jgi:hypothetical protein
MSRRHRRDQDSYRRSNPDGAGAHRLNDALRAGREQARQARLEQRRQDREAAKALRDAAGQCHHCGHQTRSAVAVQAAGGWRASCWPCWIGAER